MTTDTYHEDVGHQEVVPTQPMPAHLVTACTALAGVLEHPGTDLAVAVEVSDTLHRLLDVQPPYPPLPYPVSQLPANHGVGAALRALERAAEEAETDGSGADMLRIGQAAFDLRHLPQP